MVRHGRIRYDLQLFAKDGEGGEKTESATPKKLEDARKKGQVAKSMDAITAVSLLVFFFADGMCYIAATDPKDHDHLPSFFAEYIYCCICRKHCTG